MKNLNLFLISALVFGLASCNPKFYSPNSQNVPLISSKGEKNLTVATDLARVDVQGAYGVTQNIAVKANAGFFFPEDLDNGNGGSGKVFEIGVGYFKPLPNNFVFETYAIAGFGSFENHMPSTLASSPQTTGNISANISRFGIQPNFGYKTKKFSAAVSSRFISLNYNKIEGDLIFDGVNQLTYLKDNSSNFLIEPAITLIGGFEKVKLQLQYGYSFNVSNSNFKQDKNYVTIGLNFNLK